MTTPALTVGRLHARYRLPASRADESARLDRLLARMIHDPAIEAATGAVSGEVCIRAVETSLRIDLGDGDEDIVRAWAAAVSDAVTHAVDEPGADVVRYRSRRAALAEMTVRAAVGDTSRAWAWRSLGLWTGPLDAGADHIARMTTDAMVAEPLVIVPVLMHAAAQGVLAAVLSTLGPDGLSLVAMASARAVGAEDLRAAVVGSDGARGASVMTATPPGDEPAEGVVGGRSTTAPPAAARTLAGSRIAVAARSAMPLLLSAQARRSVAVLALLEHDPALVVGARPAATGEATTGSPAVALVAAVSEGLRPDLRPPRPGAPPSSQPPPAHRPPPRRHPAGAPGAEEVPAAQRTPAGPDPAGRDERDAPVPPSRPASATGAVTAHAGLLLLVGILDDLAVPAALATAEPSGAHSVRWMLHRLGGVLAPGAPDDDPARLAFAGLPPEGPPPDEGQPEPTFTSLLGDVAEAVEHRLTEVLGHPDEPAPQVRARVVARPGEIVADPGWIDVVMPLDSVEVGLRRAGLDRDPGWVPWLGVVLRYVYV